MCIVALAWQVLEDSPLCLISNRDERYARPSVRLHAWPNTQVIAGQDLLQGGTWMGITAQGRWAVVTNFRDGRDQQTYPTSRGQLISDFLHSSLSPLRFAQALEKTQCDYAGFNLIVGDTEQAVYMSNRGEAPQVLPKGVYVVSNGLMSEDWAKTRHLRKRFTQEFLSILQLSEQQQQAYDLEYAVWDLLQDQRQVALHDLPDTGISLALETLLSSTFIESEHYGTRCSNFLRLQQHTWQWWEKIQHGEQAGHVTRIAQVLCR